MESIRRIRRSQLPVGTIDLARYLIGKILVHKHGRTTLAGRIVETEAYVPGDASSHAFRGETARNRSLFLEHGHAYVYLIYGACFCIDVVAEKRGVGGGVLLRALEPLSGVSLMEQKRGITRYLDLARGPGRLTQQWTSTARVMAPTSAAIRHYGLARFDRRHRPLRIAFASASHAKRTGCCVSMSGGALL